VTNYEVEPPEGVCHWQIDLEDDESADLLQQLPTAVTWLERSMRQAGSKLLVHCNAGARQVFSFALGT
jgi:protein-tyrosine phosphatase